MQTKTKARKYYSELKKTGKLSGTIKDCIVKWEERQKNKPLPKKQPRSVLAKYKAIQEKLSRKTVVPLDSEEYLNKVKKIESKLRNWELGSKADVLDRRYTLIERGSNRDWNKRSTFQRGALIQSYVTCTRKLANYVIFGQTYKVKCPYGYKFDVDENGFRIIGKAGDYHPTSSDLILASKDSKYLVRKLKELALIRKNEKAKLRQQTKIIKRAELDGATVCLKDSLRAGNCLAGSISWANRHNLDSKSHYKPSKLLAMINGDSSRVSIVVAKALQRHNTEMKKGYCILADHIDF